METEIEFLPVGAVLRVFKVAGINIVQGFPTQRDYQNHNTPFFGETIGRVANRIRGAQIDHINGKSYSLAANNGPNNLHGGKDGWGKKIWDGPIPIGITNIPGVADFEGGESVKFTLTSEDGDEGFPGTVAASVTYTSGVDKANSNAIMLAMEYEAELTEGAEETIINMTNHSYFNLTGKDTIDSTQVTLTTNKYLPVDDTLVPTGGPTTHADITPGQPITLSANGPAFDYCFISNTDPTSVSIDTRSEKLTTYLKAFHPDSKIHLEISGTDPAFQFYTGDLIDVPAVSGAPARGKRSGFCCEPSRYVNACNVEEWKKMVVLKKGQKYGARIVYKAWKDE